MSVEQDRHEAELLASFGYKQELRRSMGRFSSFAVSYSGISVFATIFLLVAFVFGQAGTAGIWTWPISSVGAILVALVFADLVGRIPIAGYAYQWGSRLANPHVGWFVAVFALMGFAIGASGSNYGGTPFYLAFFNIPVNTTSTIIGATVFTLVLLAVNIVGVRITAYSNNVAVIAEIVGGTALAIVLFIWAVATHPHPASWLFQVEPGATGSYFGSFILAFLLGAFAFAGWELPADLAEETKNASNVAPRAIILSIVVTAVSGMVILIAYSYAAPDMSTVIAAPVPALAIVDYQWGFVGREIVDFGYLLSQFGASLVIMAGAARLVFSLARDHMIPTALSAVSKRYLTPAAALVAVAVFAIAMFTITALTSTTVQGYLFGTASVGYNAVYAIIAGIYIYKARRGTLPPQLGTFRLGRWAQPVAWLALLWQLFLIGTLTLPQSNQPVGITTLVVLGVGALWYVLRVGPGVRQGVAGPGTSAGSVPAGTEATASTSLRT